MALVHHNRVLGRNPSSQLGYTCMKYTKWHTGWRHPALHQRHQMLAPGAEARTLQQNMLADRTRCTEAACMCMRCTRTRRAWR